LALSVDVGAAEANYDESRVPDYELPNPLVDQDGQPITTAEQWRGNRRGEILRLFESQVYGTRPDSRPQMTIEQTSGSAESAVGPGIRRKQVTITLRRQGEAAQLHLLIYMPESTSPVPAFLTLNFNGNHTVANDPAVPVTANWVRNNESLGYVGHQASEESRGRSSSRWPIREITSRGYALATMYYGDIDPDFDDGFANGVHALYADQQRDATSWGSISAWAWGLSRAMDYLAQDEHIDAEHVAVMGHSRLGKTSLWAGATDERFALVVSNNSGCGGAALSRRAFGETVQRINTSFPHWFCGNHKKFNSNEGACPVDQHMLISLIAPRPVLICSAEEDRWADPRGEFLGGKGAHDVYRLLGTDGLAADEMPALNTPIMSRIGYHIRPGKHDVLPQDWQVYMDFADKHFAR
jgi:hypothetical protein